MSRKTLVVFGSYTVCCTLPALPFARHHGQSWAGNRGSHTPDSGGVLADPKFKIGDMGADPRKSYMIYIYLIKTRIITINIVIIVYSNK